MHVVVVAQDEAVASELASAWRAAAPGVAAEPRAVAVAPPAAPSSHAPAGDAVTDGDSATARPVVVAGARLAVGAPAPEPPGPAAPRSALPPAEAAALSQAAAASDVVVAWVAVLDAGTLRSGPVAEAAAAAAPHAVPVVALADRIEVSRRELASAGVSGAHEVHDAGLARVARSWTPGWA